MKSINVLLVTVGLLTSCLNAADHRSACAATGARLISSADTNLVTALNNLCVLTEKTLNRPHTVEELNIRFSQLDRILTLLAGTPPHDVYANKIAQLKSRVSTRSTLTVSLRDLRAAAGLPE